MNSQATPAQAEAKAKNTRTLVGEVVSDKGDKSVVVKIERTFLHPVMKKTVRRSKKYHAHDETGHKVGDVVRIQETAPISKLKRWIVINESKDSVTAGSSWRKALRATAALTAATPNQARTAMRSSRQKMNWPRSAW